MGWAEAEVKGKRVSFLQLTLVKFSNLACYPTAMLWKVDSEQQCLFVKFPKLRSAI